MTKTHETRWRMVCPDPEEVLSLLCGIGSGRAFGDSEVAYTCKSEEDRRKLIDSSQPGSKRDTPPVFLDFPSSGQVE